MSRIRTVKPSFWESESMAELSRDARLMFVGMWNHADDKGRMRGRPALVRSNVFPYDEDVSVEMVEHWLSELERVDSIRSYTVHGKPYIDIPKWDDHQVINRPQPSTLPSWDDRDLPLEQGDPVSHTDDSVNGVGTLLPGREGKGIKKTLVEIPRPDVEGVWKHYQTYHPQSTFTTKGKNNRKSIIESALRNFSAETCKQAIDGNHLDPHCNGENQAGKQYHDIELILRDAQHIEGYAALASEAAAPSRRDRERVSVPLSELVNHLTIGEENRD